MSNRLFHISEDSNIKVFEPKPSPSYFENIKGHVVFAITDKLLHNYLLPRECPRVTFYITQNTTQRDKDFFFGTTTADFVIAIENKWYDTIKNATIYCYEFPADTFIQLDEGAGYHISYQRVAPLSVRKISDVLVELLVRNVELRIMPTLWKLSERVSQSTLQYSLIRMRNAIKDNK